MSRPSPTTSATSVPQGSIDFGNDEKPWVVIKASNGVQRWVPYVSAKLNGLRVLSLDILEKNIGKPVVIYERPASCMWPSGPREKGMDTYTFVPNGDARLTTRKTSYKDWLITRKPATSTRGYIMIEGTRISSRESDMDRHWGPIVVAAEVATGNPRNTQSFVRA